MQIRCTTFSLHTDYTNQEKIKPQRHRQNTEYKSVKDRGKKSFSPPSFPTDTEKMLPKPTKRERNFLKFSSNQKKEITDKKGIRKQQKYQNIRNNLSTKIPSTSRASQTRPSERRAELCGRAREGDQQGTQGAATQGLSTEARG